MFETIAITIAPLDKQHLRVVWCSVVWCGVV